MPRVARPTGRQIRRFGNLNRSGPGDPLMKRTLPGSGSSGGGGGGSTSTLGTPFQMRPVVPSVGDTWWPPTYVHGGAAASVVNNQCRMAVYWTGRTIEIDAIGFLRSSWGASRNYRFGFYTLEEATLFPTSLDFSGNWVPAALIAGTNNFTSATFASLGLGTHTRTAGFFGLAVRVEGTVSDVVSGHTAGGNADGEFAPYGFRYQATAANRRGQGVLVSTDTTPGAMPTAATFALSGPPAETVNYDHGAVIRIGSIV